MTEHPHQPTDPDMRRFEELLAHSGLDLGDLGDLGDRVIAAADHRRDDDENDDDQLLLPPESTNPLFSHRTASRTVEDTATREAPTTRPVRRRVDATGPAPRTQPVLTTAATTDREARHAFANFYRDNAAQLAMFLLMQDARALDATQITQQTMARARKAWSTITDPRTWVRTVASRALLHRLTAVRVDATEPAERCALLPTPPDLENWIDHHELRPALMTLPPRQRQIMAWTMTGHPIPEIAEQLQLAATAVDSVLREARETLALPEWLLITLRNEFLAGLTERLDLEAGLHEVLDQQHDHPTTEPNTAHTIEPSLTQRMSRDAPPAPRSPEAAATMAWAARRLDTFAPPTRLALRITYAPRFAAAARQADAYPRPRLDDHILEALIDTLSALPEDSDYNAWIAEQDPTFRGAVTELSNHLHTVGLDETAGRLSGQLDAEAAMIGGRNYLAYHRAHVDRTLFTLRGAAAPGPLTRMAEALRHLRADADNRHRWGIDIRRSLLRTPMQNTLEATLAEMTGLLSALEQILNDFVGIDLTDIDLTGIPLEGIRWSPATTRWPPVWLERVRPGSVEIGDDIYEIHPDTGTSPRTAPAR